MNNIRIEQIVDDFGFVWFQVTNEKGRLSLLTDDRLDAIERYNLLRCNARTAA